MNGQTIIIKGIRARDQAHHLVTRAPEGAVLNIREANRTTEQNNAMWAMLSDISRAKPEGRTLTPDVWKALFLHALDHAQRFEMALDGRGMVPVGFRSSRLSKGQMGDLLTMISEYGDRHGVRWSASGIEARSDETAQQARPEGREPGRLESRDARKEAA